MSLFRESSVVSNETIGTGECDVHATNALSRGVQLEQQSLSDSGVLLEQQSEKICGYADASAHAFVAGNHPIRIRTNRHRRTIFTEGQFPLLKIR